MSTPKGFKKLWMNCTWESGEEKLAFFNHYFKNSPMVDKVVEDRIKSFKLGLIEFIKEGKIKEGDKERDIKMPDVIKEIEKGMEE